MNNNTPNLSGGVSNTTENKQISNKSKLSLGFEKERGKIASVCSAAVAALALWVSSGSSVWEQAKSQSAYAATTTWTSETTIIEFTDADETRLNELLSKMKEGSLARSERGELMGLKRMKYNYEIAMVHAERAETQDNIAQQENTIARLKDDTAQKRADTAQKRVNIAQHNQKQDQLRTDTAQLRTDTAQKRDDIAWLREDIAFFSGISNSLPK